MLYFPSKPNFHLYLLDGSEKREKKRHVAEVEYMGIPRFNLGTPYRSYVRLEVFASSHHRKLQVEKQKIYGRFNLSCCFLLSCCEDTNNL